MPDRKIMTVEKVPNELTHFAKYLKTLIEEGDSSTRNASDDGFYWYHSAVGGLIARGNVLEDNGDQFSITLHPLSSNEWELVLSKREVTGIAEGKIHTLNLWHCSRKTCEYKFTEQDAHCIICD